MNPRLSLIAGRQGGVFSRQQALASGYSPRQAVLRLNDGRWVRIRRGQYAEAADLSGLPPWEQQRAQHKQSVNAAVNALGSGTVVVSHQSALALHGAPMWGLDLQRVHVTRWDQRSGGSIAGVQHHLGGLTSLDVTALNDLPVTTVRRALMELACTASFEATVVCADAVLRQFGADEEEFARLYDVIANWPGSAAARAALAFADPASESVGESRLRVQVHRLGLPTPVLQVEFYDDEGLIGRVDFYFPEYRTVLEFDGLLKYGGGSPETLVREKRREDRLRALGLQVVRTEWSDFNRPQYLRSQLEQAFTRSAQAA